MASQLKQLRKSRKRGNFNSVDSGIRRKIRRSNRISSRSPTLEDIDRIIEDYIDTDFLLSVVNKKTADFAVESLEQGNAISGSSSDFENFISGVGKSNIANRIFEVYSEENLLNLLSQEIELKTKTIQGFAINDKIYVRQTKAGLRAFTFKDNRFAKIPKNLFR